MPRHPRPFAAVVLAIAHNLLRNSKPFWGRNLCPFLLLTGAGGLLTLPAMKHTGVPILIGTIGPLLVVALAMTRPAEAQCGRRTAPVLQGVVVLHGGEAIVRPASRDGRRLLRHGARRRNPPAQGGSRFLLRQSSRGLRAGSAARWPTTPTSICGWPNGAFAKGCWTWPPARSPRPGPSIPSTRWSKPWSGVWKSARSWRNMRPRRGSRPTGRSPRKNWTTCSVRSPRLDREFHTTRAVGAVEQLHGFRLSRGAIGNHVSSAAIGFGQSSQPQGDAAEHLRGPAMDRPR